MRSQQAPPETIRLLRERVEAVTDAGARLAGGGAAVPTRWAALDAELPRGGLAVGVLHEWIGVDDENAPARRGWWTPPLLILMHLARGASCRAGAGGAVAWIGRRVWPFVPALIDAGVDRSATVLNRSMFVDAPSDGDRLWAVDAALRCPGLVVVADASGLDMASSRRLQLAAEAGGSVGLLARPPAELRELSAAGTRWTVRRDASEAGRQRWVVRLVRCKGAHPTASHGEAWTLERTRAGIVVAPPNPDSRSHAAAAAS